MEAHQNLTDLTVGKRFDDIRNALTTQVRVLRALVLREAMTRYGEHKLGFLWALLEPIVMVTLLAVIFSVFRGRTSAGDIPFAVFVLTGFVPFTFFTNNKSQLINALVNNKALLGFPQVTSFDVITARALLESMVTLGVFIVLLVLFSVVGFDIRIQNPLGVLAACSLIMCMGVGTGFLLASLKPLLPSIQQFANALFGRPLFLTSGIFFSAESIPPEIRQYILYNPLLHAIELLRNNFFYELDAPYGDWGYAGSWAVGTLLMGLLVHQVLRRRAITGL